VSETFIKDLGLTQSPARSTMSDGNKKRNWKVFESLYYKLLEYYENILAAQNKREIIEEIKDKRIKTQSSWNYPTILHKNKYWSYKKKHRWKIKKVV